MKSSVCTGLGCLLRLSVGFLLSCSQQGTGKFRKQPYFWTLWVDSRVRPHERLPESCSRYLSAAILHKWPRVFTGVCPFCLLIKSAPVIHIKKQKPVIFQFTLSCSEGTSYSANGHSPGTPEGTKASYQLIWTVGCSLWVGSSQMAESCVWCVLLLSSWLKLAHTHHTAFSRDQRGDTWWLQWKIMVGGKSTNTNRSHAVRFCVVS